MTRRCPKHPTQLLYGGPVHFTCARGHGVQAADLNREFQARPTPTAAAATGGVRR